MPTHRRAISRPFQGLLTCVICCAIAIALLFMASSTAMSQAAGQTAAAPDSSSPFSRWFRLPAAAAPVAAQPPTQRIHKPRIAKPRKRTGRVASAALPAPAAERSLPQKQEQVQGSGWPNAEANVGRATITLLTVKTVREQLEPEPATLLVAENELSDIDRAAQPAQSAPATPVPLPSTDGSGAIERDADQAHVLARGDTMKSMMQATRLEPVLLMLAGALAGLAASRFFV